MCDRLPRKFDVQTSHVKPLNIISQATYIVPSTEELYCLNSVNYFCSLFLLCMHLLSSVRDDTKVGSKSFGKCTNVSPKD